MAGERVGFLGAGAMGEALAGGLLALLGLVQAPAAGPSVVSGPTAISCGVIGR